MKNRLVAALALGILFTPGCVTLPRHHADMEIQKLKSDLQIQQIVVQANGIIGQQRERLVRLGQIDKDGNLIPLAENKVDQVKHAVKSDAQTDTKVEDPMPAK